MLSRIAKRDNIPQATKAVYLLSIALEIEEDMVLLAIFRGVQLAEKGSA